MVEARLFQALSDPTRLKIMALLATGPLNVSGMVKRLGCAQPAVSRHLRVLRDVALIHDRRVGKEVEYSINLGRLGDVATYLRKLAGSAEAAGGAEVRAAGSQPARRKAGGRSRVVSRPAAVSREAGRREPRKPKSTPRPKPKRTASSEFVVKREKDTMDDFLL
jgi:DNA-binding transcriptional ArsR family regulator